MRCIPFGIKISQFSQIRVFQLYLVFNSWKNNFSFFVGFFPLDSSLAQSLEHSQAFKCNHFQTVRNGKQWRSLIEATTTFCFFCSKNGCWVCDIYTVWQMWLRRLSDRPLVFSLQCQYSLLSIKPGVRITTVINHSL